METENVSNLTTKSKGELVELYRRRAKHYDVTANLYYLLGFQELPYRQKAVKALHLQEGDLVVELCCGTGLNFRLLQQEVGRAGKIIGVDLTDAMLDKARERVKKNGWGNVELMHQDVAAYHLPESVDGVISTFALTLVPEYEEVIHRIHASLRLGGRFSLLDLKLPDGPLRHLAPLGVFLTKPFGIEMKLAERHPWESMQKYFSKTSLEDLFGGFTYLAVGEK